jgi:hypothetical protein
MVISLTGDPLADEDALEEPAELELEALLLLLLLPHPATATAATAATQQRDALNVTRRILTISLL